MPGSSFRDDICPARFALALEALHIDSQVVDDTISMTCTEFRDELENITTGVPTHIKIDILRTLV